MGVRVVIDGAMGFAGIGGHRRRPGRRAGRRGRGGGPDRRPAPVARPSSWPTSPGHGVVQWTSRYDVDPVDVPLADKVGLLSEWSGRLLAADAVDHVTADVLAVTEDKFYADLSRHRGHPAPGPGPSRRWRRSPSIPTGASRPCGRWPRRSVGAGSTCEGEGWDWDAELEAIPDLLAEKVRAPSVVAGPYDLVIDPTNLWLTIHESIGHATELDRAMGYEAAYAGTSFATFDQLGIAALRVRGHARHRRPDHPARAGHGGHRRRGGAGPVVRPGPRRHPHRLPAGPVHRRHQRPRVVQRLRLRRLPAARAHPADGQRLPAAGRGRGPVHRGR